MKELLHNIKAQDTARNGLAYAVGWIGNEKTVYTSGQIVELLQALLELTRKDDDRQEMKESQAVGAAQDPRN